MFETNHLAIAFDRDGTRLTAHLRGELDVDNTRTVVELVRHQLAEETTELRVDLAGVGFCDSSGLKALLGLLRLATESGGTMVLLAPNRQVRSLLTLTGLHGLLGTQAAPFDPAGVGALADHG